MSCESLFQITGPAYKKDLWAMLFVLTEGHEECCCHWTNKESSCRCINPHGNGQVLTTRIWKRTVHGSGEASWRCVFTVLLSCLIFIAHPTEHGYLLNKVQTNWFLVLWSWTETFSMDYVHTSTTSPAFEISIVIRVNQQISPSDMVNVGKSPLKIVKTYPGFHGDLRNIVFWKAKM